MAYLNAVVFEGLNCAMYIEFGVRIMINVNNVVMCDIEQALVEIIEAN